MALFMHARLAVSRILALMTVAARHAHLMKMQVLMIYFAALIVDSGAKHEFMH